MTGHGEVESREKPFLSPKQFALLSNRSLSTVRRLIKARAIPCLQPGGKGKGQRIPFEALMLTAEETSLAEIAPTQPSPRLSKSRWRSTLPH